jgi:hypothetical protein
VQGTPFFNFVILNDVAVPFAVSFTSLLSGVQKTLYFVTFGDSEAVQLTTAVVVPGTTVTFVGGRGNDIIFIDYTIV